jgi:ketosteroid isomerase-like protein
MSPRRLRSRDKMRCALPPGPVIMPPMTDKSLLVEQNNDIWHPFRASYAAGDATAFMALYTPDLIRAGGPGRTVEDFAEFAGGIRSFFEMVRERGDRPSIDFRFTERLASPVLASERGFFRITVDLAAGDQRVSYARFHTFHRKVDGRWRIAVDYDKPGADEAEFLGAVEIDDVAAFS